jgi:hypothetical protein
MLQDGVSAGTQEYLGLLFTDLGEAEALEEVGDAH